MDSHFRDSYGLMGCNCWSRRIENTNPSFSGRTATGDLLARSFGGFVRPLELQSKEYRPEEESVPDHPHSLVSKTRGSDSSLPWAPKQASPVIRQNALRAEESAVYSPGSERSLL